MNNQKQESVNIVGPAGNIEAIVHNAIGNYFTNFGVICHPHPLHKGTMQKQSSNLLW